MNSFHHITVHYYSGLPKMISSALLKNSYLSKKTDWVEKELTSQFFAPGKELTSQFFPWGKNGPGEKPNLMWSIIRQGERKFV